MSFAGVSAKIREDALQHVPRRIELLEHTVSLLELEGTPLPAKESRELQILQRFAAADANIDSSYRTRLTNLARRIASLPQQSGAPPSRAMHDCGDRPNERFPPGTRIVSVSETVVRREEAFSSEEVAVLPPRSPAEVLQIGSDDAGRRILIKHNADTTGWVSVVTSRGTPLWEEDTEASNRTAQSVAAFLRPTPPEGAGEASRLASPEEVDAVALLAAEGQLATHLSMFPVLTMPGTEQAVVFRSWNEEDDAVSTERDRLLLLELSAATANLLEVQQMVAERVEGAQGLLDHIEQDLESTRDHTAEAVANLADAGNVKSKHLQWLVPSVCLVVTGGAVFAGAHTACISCIAARGAIGAVATATSRLGTVKLAEWQKRAIQSIKDQLPRALKPMTQPHKAVLNAASKEVERRLLTKLADTASWTPGNFSWTGYRNGLTILRRRSEVRGGFSYLTSLTVDLPASHVFRIIRQLSLSGSLDPGCELCWSCPVDPEEGTWLRYLVFSNWFANRTFHCVCRCASVAHVQGRSDQADEASPVPVQEVEGDRAVAIPATIEKYVFGAASLSAEMLSSLELPSSTLGEQRGCIQVCGVVVTAVGDQTSLVEIMADVDPASLASLADRDVRLHVLRTAERITKEVHREAAEAA